MLGPWPRSAARLPLLLVLTPFAPAAAQTVAQPYASPPVFNFSAAPDPATELGRYLRELADNPRDLEALIGAGRAALGAGDANAAIGLYGRADEASPGNPRVKAGLGAAMVQLEQPREALRLFEQATSAGMPSSAIATDRGLAYDLRGENRRAQAEYQAALRANPRDDEATRRYALSLAISGDRNGALALLDPLMRRQDKAAWRASAFVLALTGDPSAAVQRTELLLPRPQAALIAPFFPRLAALSASQKASAVHFGRFPGDGRPLPDTQLADTRYGAPPAAAPGFPGALSPTFRTHVPDSLPDGSPVTAITGSLPDRPGELPSFVTVHPRNQLPAGSPLRRPAPAARGAVALVRAQPPAALAATAPSAALLVPSGRPLAPSVATAAATGAALPPSQLAATALRPPPVLAGSVAAFPPRAVIGAGTIAGPPAPGSAAPVAARGHAGPPAILAPVAVAIAGPPGTGVAMRSVASAPIIAAPSAPILLVSPPPAPLPSARTPLATAPPETVAAIGAAGPPSTPSAPLPVSPSSGEERIASADARTRTQSMAISGYPVATAPPAPTVTSASAPSTASALPTLAPPATAPAGSAVETGVGEKPPNAVAPPASTPSASVRTASADVPPQAPPPVAATTASGSRVGTAPPAPVASPATAPPPAPIRSAESDARPRRAVGPATANVRPISPPVIAAAPPPPIDLTAATAVDRIERSRARRPAAAVSGGTTDDLLAVVLPGDLPPAVKPKKTTAAPADKAASKAAAKPGESPVKKVADAKAKKAEDAKAAAKVKADKDAAADLAAAKKAPERYWVQVATGANKADLPKAWANLKTKHGAQLAGRTPWTTPLRFTNRLLVGPFKSAAEAQAYVNTVSKAGLGASTFASPTGQTVERLGSQ